MGKTAFDTGHSTHQNHSLTSERQDTAEGEKSLPFNKPWCRLALHSADVLFFRERMKKP